MRIEPLRRNQIRRCVQIEQMLFAEDGPWTARAFHTELDLGGYYLAAFSAEGELLGYAGLAILGPSGDRETSVHTIGVHPDHQGQGIGAALLRALLSRAEELCAPVFLEVRTDNDSAIRLYERHGFRRMATRKGYYEFSGADAYTMMRPAPQAKGAVH